MGLLMLNHSGALLSMTIAYKGTVYRFAKIHAHLIFEPAIPLLDDPFFTLGAQWDHKDGHAPIHSLFVCYLM